MRRSRWRGPRIGPPARLSGASLERADAELLRVLDRGFRACAAEAGSWLACAAGCSDCCFGPFPVTRLDVWRLRAGMAELSAAEPRRAAALRARAKETVGLLAVDYPGDPRSGRPHEDEQLLDAFFERHGSLPCPALAPDSGHCDLYPWRPVSCRTYGPPARFGKKRVAPCSLCFVGAPAERIEACRIEPDREGLEQRLLAGLGVAGGEVWETLIAFALLD